MAAVQRMSTGSSSVQSFASKRRFSDSSEGDEQDTQSMGYAFGGDHSAAAASSEAVAVSSWDARALKEEAQAEAEAEEAQAAPAAERSSCAARDEDDDNSDASTGCPESPRVRWGDFAFSEGEEEEAEAAGSSALPPSAEAPAKAKARWADLADSDDDMTSPKARKPAANVQQGGGLPSGHGPPPQPVETPAPPLAQQGGSSSSLPPAEANVEKDAQGKGAGKQQRGNGGGGESAATAQPARGAKRGSGSNAAASATAERRGRKGAAAWAERGGGKWQTGGGKWGGQQWWHTESRGSGGWSGAGWNQAGYYNKPSSQSKRQCQLMIGIEEEDEFCVKSKVIGRHGQNMKSIAEKTGAKLRLRGRGSGFLEGPEQVESSDPLMLCVSAPDAWAYQEAHRLARELLESVHSSYCSFCEQAGWPAPELTIEVHEGPRPGSF